MKKEIYTESYPIKDVLDWGLYEEDLDYDFREIIIYQAAEDLELDPQEWESNLEIIDGYFRVTFWKDQVTVKKKCKRGK